MHAKVLCLLAASVVLAGCTHEADIRVRVNNQTDMDVSLNIAFIKDADGEIAWEETLLVPARNPPSEEPLARAIFPSGPHVLRATAGNLAEDLHWDFGDSTKSVEITITESGIELYLREL